MRTSSRPGLSVSALIEGWRLTFTFRPCDRMLTVASSLTERYTPVRRGRRTELVDLFLERGDLLTCLVESIHQLLVLVERLQERAVDLAELALSEARLLRYFSNVDVDDGPSRGHAAPPPVILIPLELRWPPEAKGAFAPVDATMKPRSPRLMCPIWGPRGPVNNRGNHCMRAGESPKSSGKNSAESERTRVG